MVGFTPFFIGYVIGAKTLFDFDLFYGFVVIACLTSSTFVLNHICDLDIDLKNPRKEFSLLVVEPLMLDKPGVYSGFYRPHAWQCL